MTVIFLLETKRRYGRLSYSDDRLFLFFGQGGKIFWEILKIGLVFALLDAYQVEKRSTQVESDPIALWQLNTHSSGTFLCGGESSSRMKVRQDPPAHPGYNGKQGGERFRTILKYPTATDMAMKRYRANDTSLRSWRRTRQGWDSHGPDSLSGVWWFPFLHLGFEEKLSATTKAPRIIFEVLVDQKWFK